MIKKVLDFVRNVKCSKTASRNTDINFNIRNEDFLVKSKNIYISIWLSIFAFQEEAFGEYEAIFTTKK